MGSVFVRTRTHKNSKNTDYWVIEYQVNGKPRRETVGKVGVVTKSIARELLKKRELQVKLGQWDMIGAEIPTLSEFVPEYLTYVRDIIAKRSWNRDQLSLTHLNSFFGDRKLSAITPKDIQDYQGKRLKEGAKPATVNRELACFKHLFNIAKQRANFFGDNPVSKVKFLEENNQIERVLTLEEQERLIANSAPHLKPIIVTAIHTGMRKNEMLSLKWVNVDFEHNIIIVEATNTKSKKLKRVPINSKLRKVLIEQKLKTGLSEYVFLNPHGKPYQRHDSLKRCFEGACRRAGIKGLRFHDLRHTAATRMLEKGANIAAVSRMLGHSSWNTTMRYAHPEDSLREAAEKLVDFESTTDQSTDQQKRSD